MIVVRVAGNVAVDGEWLVELRERAESLRRSLTTIEDGEGGCSGGES